MQPFSTMGRCSSLPPHAISLPAMPLQRGGPRPLSSFARLAKRRCEITIISFSRSICRGGLAALIGVTGKPYPSCLSCHSHPIRPFRAPSPRGEGGDTRIPSSKKGGEAATRTLNPEPNESKVKRGCEEMNPHFFTAPSDQRFSLISDQRGTL